jgi:hypothetical protein
MSVHLGEDAAMAAYRADEVFEISAGDTELPPELLALNAHEAKHHDCSNGRDDVPKGTGNKVRKTGRGPVRPA